MPRRPKIPCSSFGCKNLIEPGTGGRCDEHRRKERYQKDKDYDRQRGTRQERGYDATHYRLKALVQAEQPLCPHCYEAGKLTPGEELHHIDGDAWNRARDNVVLLCRPCHDAHHERWGSNPYRPRFDAPACTVVIVCGPPGSGKSTWAQEQAIGRDDIVIDLDVIKADATGTRIYERQDDNAKAQAIRERNSRLMQLHRKTTGFVYFIISGAKRSEREWWRDRLQAQRVVVIEVSEYECKRRIEQDSRRPELARKLHIMAAANWWQRYERGAGEEVVRG